MAYGPRTLMLIAASFGAASAGAPAGDAASARAEATKQLRAKNNDAACPKFELAVRLAPEDPEPLADLALCEQRRGSEVVARELNRKVIDLGSATRALTDARFARSRRHAYFNLSQIDKDNDEGHRAQIGRQSCGQFKPEPGCAKGLFYCATWRTDGGTWRTFETTRVRIAASAGEAKFDEMEVNDSEEPDFDEFREPVEPTPDVVSNEDSVTYIESYSEEGHDWKCDQDENAWSCERSAAVAAEVKKCLASSGGATSEDACRKHACERATHQPWPAIIKERKAIDKNRRRCHADADRLDGEYGCQLVYANACTGLAGLVCTGRHRSQKKVQSRVEEYLFEPPS